MYLVFTYKILLTLQEIQVISEAQTTPHVTHLRRDPDRARGVCTVQRATAHRSGLRTRVTRRTRSATSLAINQANDDATRCSFRLLAGAGCASHHGPRFTLLHGSHATRIAGCAPVAPVDPRSYTRTSTSRCLCNGHGDTCDVRRTHRNSNPLRTYARNHGHRNNAVAVSCVLASFPTLGLRDFRIPAQ